MGTIRKKSRLRSEQIQLIKSIPLDPMLMVKIRLYLNNYELIKRLLRKNESRINFIRTFFNMSIMFKIKRRYIDNFRCLIILRIIDGRYYKKS